MDIQESYVGIIPGKHFAKDGDSLAESATLSKMLK